MKKTNNTNKCNLKRCKNPLQEVYETYHSLPQATITAPKTDLLATVANKCDVSLATARNWIQGRSHPQKEKYVKIIAEVGADFRRRYLQTL